MNSRRKWTLASITLSLWTIAFHKTELVRQTLEEHKLKLLYLPLYSPMLNPIEECFSKIQCLINKRHSNDGQQLMRSIDLAMAQVNPINCASWFRHSKKFFSQCLNSRPIGTQAGVDGRDEDESERDASVSGSMISDLASQLSAETMRFALVSKNKNPVSNVDKSHLLSKSLVSKRKPSKSIRGNQQASDRWQGLRDSGVLSKVVLRLLQIVIGKHGACFLRPQNDPRY